MSVNVNIYGNTISMAAKALDFLWQKETAISHNLANVETPDYKARYITFEETFKNALTAAGQNGGNVRENVASAINSSTYRVNTSQETARADGNNVQADTEYMEMTRTALQYQYLARSISSDISRLNTVITGQ